MSNAAEPLLVVRDLEKSYPVRGGGVFGRSSERLRAVDGISFEVRRGETFGIVGESGCGKSTAARCILRLIEPSAGSVRFAGTEIATLGAEEMRRLRRRMQMVFQDTTGTLDPRMSVLDLVAEPLLVHGVGTAAERRAKVEAILGRVGIRPELASRRPYEFSGGQRQRIGLARALVLDPELVVLDEPISALDVSVQAQILNLLRDLQEERGLTYVFIVHDLTVAEYFCDRIAVLYLGQVMEIGTSKELFAAPLHPYTASLLSAVPRVADRGKVSSRIVLRGEASPLRSEMAAGCVFRARCPIGHDRAICAETRPSLTVAPAAGAQQAVACHFAGEMLAGH